MILQTQQCKWSKWKKRSSVPIYLNHTKKYIYDPLTKEQIKEHIPNWPKIADHPYRILVAKDSGSGKAITSFNLIKKQLNIDKNYLYAKDPYKGKHQFLINKRKSTGLKYSNDL